MVKSLLQRPVHLIFFLYFVSHIPITILVDAQSLLGEFYPQVLKDVVLWYLAKFQDPLLTPPYHWWFNVRCFVYSGEFDLYFSVSGSLRGFLAASLLLLCRHCAA